MNRDYHDPIKSHHRKYKKKSAKPWVILAVIVLIILAVIACLKLRSGSDHDNSQDSSINETPALTETLPAETEPPGPVVQTVTISAAGDIALGTLQTHGYSGSLREMAERNGTDYFLQNVRHVFEEDDMTLVNFEACLTTATEHRTDQEFLIKGDPEWAWALPAGSVEACAFSNNHDWDYLEQGWSDTVSNLEGVGMVVSYEDTYGYYTTDEGFTIGMVSVNKLNRLEEARATLQRGINALREEGVDIVIAYIHMGVEMAYYPEDYAIELDHQCIDWGADLVLNTHTHCLRGIEQYNGKFIVYGLGNFCFGANRNPSDKDTMIFQQTWTFVDGEMQPDINVHVEPCSISSTSGRNDYCPTTLEGSQYDRVLANINTYSSPFGTQFDQNGNYIPN